MPMRGGTVPHVSPPGSRASNKRCGRSCSTDVNPRAGARRRRSSISVPLPAEVRQTLCHSLVDPLPRRCRHRRHFAGKRTFNMRAQSYTRPAVSNVEPLRRRHQTVYVTSHHVGLVCVSSSRSSAGNRLPIPERRRRALQTPTAEIVEFFTES
jgi:hypothetical protein